MALLQDPLKALDQIEWYLDHREHQKFPGAFELAAGNLCRQTLEQILFILCFFSRMKKTAYIRGDKTLKTAGQLLGALDKRDPTGRTFWELARKRGPRIRKFARYPRTLKKWQRELNEPSHFSTNYRTVDEEKIREFVAKTRVWFDEKDGHLLVAAVNELHSGGKIEAVLLDDQENTPGISQEVVVTASNICKTDTGGLALQGPQKAWEVISDTEVPRGRWPGKPVLVVGTVGMSIGFHFVTKRGDPIHFNNIEGMLQCFARTRGQRSFLVRRLRQLGIEVEISR